RARAARRSRRSLDTSRVLQRFHRLRSVVQGQQPCFSPLFELGSACDQTSYNDCAELCDVTAFLTRCNYSHSQPAAAGGGIKPGVERGSAATPGISRKYTSSPRSGRQLFVIRHYQWLSPASRAVAINPDRTWGCGCAPPQALLCRPLSRAKID